MHRTFRLLLLLAPLALAGCASALARLPAPAADARREAVEPGERSCADDRCARDVRVGDRRIVVRERSRDDRGGVGTVARGAASTMAEAMPRGGGFATSHLAVGLASRVVEDGAGTLRLACDLAWIDDVRRERARGAERSAALRLAEGWRCDAADRADTTAVRWTLRGGIEPDADSVAAIAARLERGEIGTVALDRPMRLARTGAAAAAYGVVRSEGEAPGAAMLDLRPERWVVRRSDGTVVGTVHHSPLPTTALDLAGAATREERDLLRLLAATIALPLR